MNSRSRTRRKKPPESAEVILRTPIRVAGIELRKLTVREPTQEGYDQIKANTDTANPRLRDLPLMASAVTGISPEEAGFLTIGDADRVLNAAERISPREE